MRGTSTSVIGLVIGLILTTASTARSDGVAEYFGDGATVFALDETKIFVAKEKVVIAYDATQPAQTRWRSDCHFTLENPSDEAATVQVGFPEDETYSDGAGFAWTLHGFAVTVDGKRVSARHVPLARNVKRPVELPRLVNVINGAVYLWPVSLAPRARVEVRVSYQTADERLMTMTVSDCMTAKEKSLRYWRSGSKRDVALFENQGCSQFRHVVTTGKTWPRPIAEAEIAIAVPPDVWPHAIVPLRQATEIDGDWVRWRFTAYSPTEELGVLFAHSKRRLASVDQAKAWLLFAKDNGGTRSLVRRLVDKYGALKNATPVDRQVRALIESELSKFPD